MKHISAVRLLALIVSAGILTGCATESSVEHADRLFQHEPSAESKTVSLEEIRGDNGTRIIGYLEEVSIPVEGSTERRHLYYVYNQEYESIQGVILDNGRSFRHSGGGSLDEVGYTGLRSGLKQILSYEGAIQFYRNGRQISRGSG